MSTDRSATVAIKNATGTNFQIQVLHQYTGDGTEDSGFIEIQSGQQLQIPNYRVHYRTGFFTTGVDNWIVNGIELREVDASFQLPPGLPPIPLGGTITVKIRWRSGTGFGSDWKVHTLRSEDENTDTTIVIFPDTLEFHSNSGTSSTGWHSEFDSIVPRPIGG